MELQRNFTKLFDLVILRSPHVDDVDFLLKYLRKITHQLDGEEMVCNWIFPLFLYLYFFMLGKKN